MKRTVLATVLAGLVICGLCVAAVWSAQGTTWTTTDEDPNGGETAQPEWIVAATLQPAWLADEPESDDPNEPPDSPE
ncbi:MAG: hypothetical protein KBE04_04660 [Phycisphaerae bacterium]|nr:hypothetical protein [Phycisphaerae bacterium]